MQLFCCPPNSFLGDLEGLRRQRVRGGDEQLVHAAPIAGSLLGRQARLQGRHGLQQPRLLDERQQHHRLPWQPAGSLRLVVPGSWFED